MTSTPESVVRLQVYRHFVEHGRAPSAGDLASALRLTAGDVEQACLRLAEAHAIALDPKTKSIRMAHPFSGVPTRYPVEAGGVSYWANCAWDTLGIAALLRADTRAAAQCADCGEPLDLSVRNGSVADDTAVIHFLVPAVRFWDDIAFT